MTPSLGHRVLSGCLALAVGLFLAAILTLAVVRYFLDTSPFASRLSELLAVMSPGALQMFWLVIFSLSQRHGWARLRQPVTVKAFVPLSG